MGALNFDIVIHRGYYDNINNLINILKRSTEVGGATLHSVALICEKNNEIFLDRGVAGNINN